MFVLSMDFIDQASSNARNSLEILAAILLNMQAATAPRNKQIIRTVEKHIVCLLRLRVPVCVLETIKALLLFSRSVVVVISFHNLHVALVSSIVVVAWKIILYLCRTTHLCWHAEPYSCGFRPWLRLTVVAVELGCASQTFLSSLAAPQIRGFCARLRLTVVAFVLGRASQSWQLCLVVWFFGEQQLWKNEWTYSEQWVNK